MPFFRKTKNLFPKGFTSQVASAPELRRPYAEIHYNDEEFAEITQEKDRLRISLYPRDDGQSWDLDYLELVRTLDYAKERLTQHQAP